VLIPRTLLAAWGDVEEVEIEQRVDAIIVMPKESQSASASDQMVRDMNADSLVATLPWKQPRTLSAEKRTELVEELGRGRLLSEVIIEGRLRTDHRVEDSVER